LAIILAGIDSLEQHLSHWQSSPDEYRPSRCPSCGKGGLWHHGCYGRKSDRENPPEHSLNPVPIPRFRCPHCRETCSTLPECIPPRRWYLWQVQQAALILMLAATSLQATSRQLLPSRKTLRRWRQRLKDCFVDHAFCLRGRHPELGRVSGFEPFWQACLEHIPLSRAMIQVQQGGFCMP
jgi:transposase-like protein